MSGHCCSCITGVIIDIIQFLIDLPYYIYLIISSVLCSAFQCILPRKKKSLDFETILVTGAAAGIGREAVIQLAKVSKQATFVLWDINEKGLLETSEECRKLGANVYSYVVDLTQRDDVIQTAAKVRQQVGNITILFNNAGLVQFNTFLDANPVMEQKILEVNLHSYMWTIREFLPGMIERGSGHIVSTCSGLATMRFRYLSAYVASKHGLKGFLDCLKLEMSLHPDKPDIKFTTIYPGWVKTNMTTGVTWDARYKTWKVLQQLDSDIVTKEIVDGILKEKEEIMVPGQIRFMKYFYGMIPTRLMDRIENLLFRDIKIQNSATNSTVEMTPPVAKTHDNMASCNISLSPNPQTAILMPEHHPDEVEHLNSLNVVKSIQ